MPVPVSLEVAGSRAKITPIGQVVTAPFDYDNIGFVNLDADNVAENLFKPRAGSRLVLTGCILSADRNIGVNGVLINVYEATTDTETTIVKDILQLDMPKSTFLPLFPLNLLVSEGVYVNAKAADSNVSISMFAYYVPA